MNLFSTFFLYLYIAGFYCFECLPGNLAVYTLKIQTFWDESTFPKQFPLWRPPAQWSKTLGFVHGEGPDLFTLGAGVSAGVKQFVETGDSEILEQEIGNSSSTILDTILVPQITQGVGESLATVFVDGSHSQISIVTKIVPSPDWFIGLDSLQLCEDGKFKENISIQAELYDAGTDNGFTFTSPNWPTEPQGVVFKITSTYPTHPAGSFHYPHLEHLPTLAVYSLTKERDYELVGQHKAGVQDFIYAQKTNKKEKYEYSLPNHLGTKSLEIIDFIPIDETRVEPKYDVETNQISQTTVSGGLDKRNLGIRGSISGYLASSAPEDFLKKKYKSEFLSAAEDLVFHSEKDLEKKRSEKAEKKKKKEMMDKILGSYQAQAQSRIGQKKKRFRKRKQHRSQKKTRSCEVSTWIGWSACSKSCGIGEAVRTRTILKHPRHGGTPCPKLRDYKWCGSARNCNSRYFDW
ncbi:uncharacterized protein LOC111698276 [Eurytemora carolleeae]|uniref:uncharacterized protein LOC111698276 n=1 Tax=Eurytemora carolleeae TaxID=1294199 RepID=UPI000C788378|nr:uncharacterized protein LOC111698276 [Eurytemora carolleeae]|eukprot:XP_023324329.1 uncharacterized protein LOC111698276 [Eurytemora affinis]